MYLPSTLIAVVLLAGAEGVLGGSRLWEAKAPNPRTNPNPEYPTIETLDSTSSIVRRAFSIRDQPDPAKSRIWPNKKIRYCFQDTGNDSDNVVLKGLWESAMELWAELKDHGFTYEHVTNKKDCDKFRSTVLRIHYNDKGKLSSTLGLPPIDQNKIKEDPNNDFIKGPYTLLSAKGGIGQDNVPANVAHELGHVWGLGHEHQNPHYWEVTFGDNGWAIPAGKGETYFQTSDFNCANLKDHDDVQRNVQKLIDAETDPREKAKLQGEKDRLCISQAVAGKYGFSAVDWIPGPNVAGMQESATFDKDSLMMYPSKAGGIGSGDGRAIVMRYKDTTVTPDRLIPNRVRPSVMDIEHLKTLYGNQGSASLGVPHVSRQSKLGTKFRDLRKKLSGMGLRAGATEGGVDC